LAFLWPIWFFSGFDVNQYPNFAPVLQSFVVTLSISGLMWGVMTFAFGELLRVLIDIALNTGPLSEIARVAVEQERRRASSAAVQAHR
jgi:hypothetical protein